MPSNLILFYIIFGLTGLYVTHASNYTNKKYVIYLALYIIATFINYMISTKKTQNGERKLNNTSIINTILLTFNLFLYVIFLVFSALLPDYILNVR